MSLVQLSKKPQRSCGECFVCCTVAEVSELDKPSHKDCKYSSKSSCGSCSIFNDPKRPNICNTFQCAWMRGFGNDDGRPDQIGAMFSINNLNGGTFVFAIETVESAILTTAKSMLLAAARQTKIPVVISDYKSKPPNDTGDRVAIINDITHRARAMLGDKLAELAEDVSLYVLRK